MRLLLPCWHGHRDRPWVLRGSVLPPVPAGNADDGPRTASATQCVGSGSVRHEWSKASGLGPSVHPIPRVQSTRSGQPGTGSRGGDGSSATALDGRLRSYPPYRSSRVPASPVVAVPPLPVPRETAHGQMDDARPTTLGSLDLTASSLRNLHFHSFRRRCSITVAKSSVSPASASAIEASSS